MVPQTIRNDLEPSRIMRAQGFDYDHEIQVALPPSYDTDPDATYPVLWLTDGREYLSATATLVRQYAMARLIPELIVVSVGPPSDLNDVVEIQRRRTFDFSPKEDVLYDGLGGQKMRQMMAAMGDAVPTMPGGGAPGFLDFLVDEVRPALAADYRTGPRRPGALRPLRGRHVRRLRAVRPARQLQQVHLRQPQPQHGQLRDLRHGGGLRGRP